MVQLRKERARSRLHHNIFYYHIYRYSSKLADYFVRDLEPLLHQEGLNDELTNIHHAEQQQLVSQLHLSDGALYTSFTILITPHSLIGSIV